MYIEEEANDGRNFSGSALAGKGIAEVRIFSNGRELLVDTTQLVNIIYSPTRQTWFVNIKGQGETVVGRRFPFTETVLTFSNTEGEAAILRAHRIQ